MNKEDIEALYQGMRSIANSITPPVAGNVDATGGYVSSLTEAVMGHTKAMLTVAEALTEISDSIDGIAFQLAQLVETQDKND